jgi:hypothetical protein
MRDLSALKDRNIIDPPHTSFRPTSERARRIIASLIEDVNVVTGMLPEKNRALVQAVALATFRGAFKALQWSEDDALRDFVEKGLVRLNEGGLAALTEFGKVNVATNDNEVTA